MLTKKRLNFLSKYLFLSESDAYRITFYELQDSRWETETIPTVPVKKKQNCFYWWTFSSSFRTPMTELRGLYERELLLPVQFLMVHSYFLGFFSYITGFSVFSEMISQNLFIFV